MFKILTLLTAVICAQASATEVGAPAQARNTRQDYNTVRRIASDGYYAEAHSVTTSDGYILETLRIPIGRHESKNDIGRISKPVVFLMHGLQSSSLSYVASGADRSLGYVLAEAGYDVWLGSARGSLNSRRHIRVDPDADPKTFFDYSFEDIGMKDLPAMIDYVLRVTGRSRLHYIGHSQGGTAFMVLNSMLPEYNKKIQSAHLLAGVGYMAHFPNRALSLVSISTNLIYSFALRQNLVEIMGPDTFNSFHKNCSDTNTEACGLSTIGQVLSNIFGNMEIIAGASMKQYAHFGQNIRSKSFRRWDYNPVTNLARYGSITPPQYNLGRITIDVTMHYTLNDDLLDEKDVLKMVDALPNARARKVARESFTHTDFAIAKDAKELVYDYIVAELNKQPR